MPITAHQKELLSHHQANYTTGLTTSEASQRRHYLNKVQKPINCPSWVCCLLPCINHIPSMKQFRYVQPDDAEVLRDNGRWIRYDASSLVVGDIVRLVEGDVVPADCVVISLGMEHVDETIVVDEESGGAGADGAGAGADGAGAGAGGVDVSNNNESMMDELTVDSHYITGESKPRHISYNSNQTIQSTLLYYGSRVLEGACIGLVVNCGENTVLAKLIREKRWPPKGDLSKEVENMFGKISNENYNDDYDSSGIALVQRY